MAEKKAETENIFKNEDRAQRKKTLIQLISELAENNAGAAIRQEAVSWVQKKS